LQPGKTRQETATSDGRFYAFDRRLSGVAARMVDSSQVDVPNESLPMSDNTNSVFEYRPGSLPVLVSVPHAGTYVPEEIRARMTEASARLPDTDWYVPKLYDVHELDDATWIMANVSRYVVDLNRPPDNQSLYPGQATTGLCPETNFDGTSVYRDGAELAREEIDARVEKYWRPYHSQLRHRLESIRGQFGFVVLIDLHSIASQVPNLFTGVLPDLNYGTNGGKSVSGSFQAVIERMAAVPQRYKSVVNGRFVGGYITRHYGNPNHGIEALQIELSQATYLDERTAKWEPAKVAKIQPVLRETLQTILAWTRRESSRRSPRLRNSSSFE
jgi:N-formylglutamate deformylase